MGCDVSSEITNSAIAGVLAALVATIILGIAKWITLRAARSREIAFLREILSDGRRRVYEAKDTFHKGMNATSPADCLRAARYNNMLKRLDPALKYWTPNLSQIRKKAIFDALNWYNTDSLLAKVHDGAPVWVEPPEGKWLGAEMSMEAARSKFEKIEEIRWLRLSKI